MLAIEGLPENEHGFDYWDTHILTDEDNNTKGFFTLKKDWGIPSLLHFCVEREFRNAKTARALIKEVVNTVKKLSYNQMIIHSKSEFLDKFINYYFKRMPYAVDKNGYAWYLINIKTKKEK